MKQRQINPHKLLLSKWTLDWHELQDAECWLQGWQ